MFLQYFYQKTYKKVSEANKASRASILVVCLWSLMVLSILGMGLTGLIFQQIRFAKAYQRIVFSLPIARAALKNVIYLRKDDPSPAYDTLEELTKENKTSLCNGNSYKYYFADKKDINGNTEIIDESSLINLNTASIDVLKKLPGLDEDLAEEIVACGFRPFNAINEVLLVEGIDQGKFLQFKDLVTVYGQDKININTVRKEVLLALGLEEELVKIIIRFRQEHKIEKPDTELIRDKELTQDAEYGFSSVDKIIEELRSFASLSLRQEQDLLALLSKIDVKSEYLRFNIIPYSGSRPGVHYSIVIHPATKKILSWNEY